MVSGPTAEQEFTGELLICIMGSLSLISSTIIILSIVTFPKLRTFNNRLVLYLSIADVGFDLLILMQGYSYMAGPIHFIAYNWTACQIFGTIMQFFKQCSNFWACFIAFTLYMKVIRKEYAKMLEKPFLIASTVISLICAILQVSIFEMGPALPWCWVAKGPIQIYGQQLLFYDFVYLDILAILFFYAAIIRKIIQVKSSAGTYDVKTIKAINRLAFFPIAFLFVWIPTISRRIWENYHSFTYAGFILQSLLNPADGTLNLLGYGIGRNLLGQYIALWQAQWNPEKPATTSMDDFKTSSTITTTTPESGSMKSTGSEDA